LIREGVEHDTRRRGKELSGLCNDICLAINYVCCAQ
jgi:hypothetical protein